MMDTRPPPVRFDNPVPMIVRHLSIHEIHRVCGTGFIAGCQGRENGVCIVNILRPLPRNVSAAFAIRHERAHCNGWTGEHER